MGSATPDERDHQITYVEFANESHTLVRQGNRLAFMAMVERFFASHLGGLKQSNDDDLDSTAILVEQANT